MNEVTKIVDKNLNRDNLNSIDSYIREKEEFERQQKIAYLVELIRNNPDITKEMVRSDLKKYLGIVTSRTKEELEELDELLDCIDLFDVIITSDMVKEPKPNPESINIIIEKYNLSRDETIYIGDSPSDAIASKKANIKFGFAS